MRVLGHRNLLRRDGRCRLRRRGGLLAHELHSQVDLHATYGGVVPELASRDHLRKLLPLVEKVVRRERRRRGQSTASPTPPGPGLVGALLVGAAVARSLAYAWQVPCIGVHHMEGHLLAPLLEPDPPALSIPRAAGLRRPHAARARATGSAGTRSSADRSTTPPARPSTRPRSCWASAIRAGRSSPRLAEQGRPDVFRFPRPMTERPGLDFSFSGLKTAVVVALRGPADSTSSRAPTRRSAFEEAVVDTLVIKCQRALDATGAAHAGGRGRRGRQSAPARAHAGDGRAQRGAGRLPACRVLHRQRRDDRAAGPPAARGRRARRPRHPLPGRAGR